MNKNQLRLIWRQIRQKIPHARRNAAKLSSFEFIKSHGTDGFVLSYASFNDELDTSHINDYLATQGRLVLPKMEGGFLKTYQVDDLVNQLIINSYGIAEPNPVLCQEIDPKNIATILVPGLVYDCANTRIGYGKGCYDQFLAALNRDQIIYGLGFKEQFSENLLPAETHDIPLLHVMLF